MALWAYSDWICQTSDADRLTRLRLHIAEVSNQLIETKASGVEVGKPDPEYLQGLMKEERRLGDAVARSTPGRNRGRNRVDLRRDY